MNQNRKRAFVLIACLMVWRTYEGIKLRNRIDDMEEKLDIVDKVQDNIIRIMDNNFQIEVEERFAEIVEHFDD